MRLECHRKGVQVYAFGRKVKKLFLFSSYKEMRKALANFSVDAGNVDKTVDPTTCLGGLCHYKLTWNLRARSGLQGK